MRKAALSCLLVSGVLLAAPPKKCEDLAHASFGTDVKIDSAAIVPATDKLREYCEVRGVIWPENHFAVKLPTFWNARFEMVGNGGWAGVLSLAAMDTAVRDGYAAASTDTGHDAQKEPGAIFAYPGPNNPNAARKIIDHGYLAVHETALLAKKLIRAYYDSDPRYSYWVGCSTGGRQGLMEAQRYPEDFDGYVVGAPVLYLSGLQMKAVWNYRAAGPGPGEISPQKSELLTQAVYQKCDGLDGLVDGLIENPAACDFDPVRDLAVCAGSSDGASCFTAPQIAALKKVYDGPRDSKGKQLFPGIPAGAGDGAPGNFRLADTFMKFMAFDPAPGPTWDYHSFNFDTDIARLASISLRIDATIPDLTAVKMRGGKIIHYHGYSDPGVTAKMSINYYEAAEKTMGQAETRDFYRLFLVPGMFHCGGGPGCGNVDWLTAAVNWVEKGIAPTMLEGAHVEAGKTTRTRPICAYPAVARYRGTGSIDMAENFSCTTSGL
ncbi:MAG: tannase/feruloyl esterase family alpha/beta hydrolase [Acidobacteriia bacterium]|nr:tannase/feruloyl esterase family alpha/beta hydrolase [Terriglobia bacterium]